MAVKCKSECSVGLRLTISQIIINLTFPGGGIKDGIGNYLLQYATVGAFAVNYLKFINSVSGNAVVLTAGGTDTDISITITPVANGVLTLDTLTATSDGLPGSFLFTDGAGSFQFTSAASLPISPVQIIKCTQNGTFGVPQTALSLTLPQDIDITSSPTFDAPIFTAPLLGTPASGILTNCTGLPLTKQV